jgi:tetratricopeptide (TPR) repeat protein
MAHSGEQAYIAKLSYYRQRPGSLAKELREDLHLMEDGCAELYRRDKSFIVAYFARLDKTQQGLRRLAAMDGGPNVTPEKLQFKVVQHEILRDAERILRKLGGSEALRQARPAQASEAEQPWWFLDRYLFKQRARLLKRAAQGLGIMVAIGLAAIIFFNVFIKPNRQATQHAEHFSAAFDTALREEDYEAALAEIDLALANMPDEPETLILKGILLEELGRFDEAEAVFAHAATLVDEPEKLRFFQTRLLLELGRPEEALPVAEAAIDLNPNFAEGWLMMGLAYADLKQYAPAYEAMNTAAQLAGEQGNGALKVMIRVNMSSLGGGQGVGF